MSKLAAPYVARGSGRSASRSVFNEGVSVPEKDWARITAKNPALVSKDKSERAEATKKAVLKGELAKYRKR